VILVECRRAKAMIGRLVNIGQTRERLSATRPCSGPILLIVGYALSRTPISRPKRNGRSSAVKGHPMNMPTNTKPWIQGAVVGAIVVSIVGFSWGGWVTGGTAAKNMAAASHDAVVAALAPICVERFRAQPDAVVKADALIKSSSWERGNMVEKSGFATMPGSKTTDSDVARACAEILATAAVPKS
jgi:hypothetical protein